MHYTLRREKTTETFCKEELMSEYSKVVNEEKQKFKEFCNNSKLEDFKYVVHVFHEDGSTFILYNSSFWESEVVDEFETPRFIGVATEHNGDHFFFSGDLHRWNKFEMYSVNNLEK